MTLTEKIVALKRERGCISNMYSLAFVKNVTETHMSDGAVVASYEDHGVMRIVFCAVTEGELPELMSRLKASADLNFSQSRSDYPRRIARNFPKK